MKILNIILSKLCFCFTSPAEDESSSRAWSSMPRQYQNHSFPRSYPPAQRDFISLRERSPIFKGERHTKIQDVNFDDRYSSIDGTNIGFETPAEGCGTSNMEWDNWMPCGSDLRVGWNRIMVFDNIFM
jgi:hypothetical protein